MKKTGHMIRRRFALALMSALALSLTACGKKADDDAGGAMPEVIDITPDYSGIYSNENKDSITFIKNDDGSYSAEVVIVRLCDMEGNATGMDSTLALALTDPAGGKLTAIFFRDVDGSYTLRISESNWDLLEPETEFTGFIKGARADHAEQEMSAEDALFDQFLMDEIKAEVAADSVIDLTYACVSYEEEDDGYQGVGMWEGAENFGMSDWLDMIRATADIDASHMTVYSAVMETTSGQKALVVKCDHIGIDRGEYDESCAYFVYTVEGDALKFVYAVDSWSRKHVNLLNGVVFHGYGSQGAGDSTEWYGYIDETGYFRTIWSMQTLYDSWVSDYGLALADMESDSSWASGCELSLATTINGNFYSYRAEDTVDMKQLDVLCSALDDAGWRKSDDAELDCQGAMGTAGVRKDSGGFEGWQEREELASDEVSDDFGKVVYPIADTSLAETASDGVMPDSRYHVGFHASDVEKDADGITILVQFYNYDSFLSDDIDALEVGDSIMVSQKTVRIDQLEKNEGSVVINGGWEMGGYTLRQAADGSYSSRIDNDFADYYPIGSATLSVSEACSLSDVRDYDEPTADNVEYSYEDMPECFGANGQTSYDPLSTTLILEGGRITQITRVWTP